MRNFILLFLSIFSVHAFAQTSIVQSADSVTTTQSFIPWWNLQNGTVADGQNIETELCPSAPSDTLNFRDFGFAVPANATIIGVQVDMGKSASDVNQVVDFNVSLINNGSISNNQANTTYWNTFSTYTSYGGPNDVWGASLTPAIVNSPDFGFMIQTQASTSTCVNAWIDYAIVFITYTIPFECEYALDIQEEQQCSNFFMFNSYSPPFDAEIEGLWYFGEGDPVLGGYSIEHWYELPGSYDGYVEFSSDGCPDSTIYFTIEALECNDCLGSQAYFYPTDNCGEFNFEVAVFEPNTNAYWNFGDGNSEASGSFTTHTYDEPGVYVGSVWYTSDQCSGSQYTFTVIVEDCENDCAIEIFWEEITCEYYSLTAATNHPDAVVSWTHDGVFIGTGTTINVPFPDEGVHVVCASYETPECPEGVEVCHNFDVDFGDCNECPDEVYIEQLDCDVYYLEVVGDESGIVNWNFGDGSPIVYDGGMGIDHLYQPGTYFGSASYYSESCLDDVIIPFTIFVQGCGDECAIEMYWNIINCEEYNFAAEINHPDAVVSWTYDGEFLGTGISINVLFPTEGIHVVCASYETPDCPEGVEVCYSFDIDWNDCTECPYEVGLQPLDDCGNFYLSVYGDDSGSVDWDFGDGTPVVFGSDIFIDHFYEPGTYYGNAVYYSETCDDIYISFSIYVEGCEECEDNLVEMTWSVAQFGSDQGFLISLFEVGEDINSLEYIDSDECFASDFSSCEFDYCLEDGCYAFYISSSPEFEIFDFDLSIFNNGDPLSYTMNGVSPTVGVYFYFTLGDSSCPFEDNCILDFGYEILEDGTYVFSALTNSTADVVWDFGDGTTGTGWPIDHVFDGPDDYEVCVAFADNELCSNEPSCGIVIVEDEEECTDVMITIGYDLPDEEIELLEFSLEFQGIEIQNQTITLSGLVSLVTLYNCLEDGCYAFEIIPTDPIYDLSGVSISVTIPGNSPVEGTYDEDTNSITLLFGVNDDECATSDIAENGIGDLMIYPNPVANELNIQLERNIENLQYALINVLGQVVKSGQLNNTNNQIQVGSLSEGQYQLVIKNEYSIQTKAISITR